VTKRKSREQKLNSISVVISTYNGENYIDEQIKSIISQKDVDIYITIRDDGSKDGTIQKLNEWKKEYPKNIKVICGNNLGYADSFLDALKNSFQCDYYAYCDQDDIWLPEKCIKGIEKLKEYKDVPALYSCSPTICNENLEDGKINNIANGTNCIESYFTRSRIPGCCMIFNKCLKDIVIKMIDFNNDHIKNKYLCGVPAHDAGTCIFAYSFGKVILDSNSYMLHRRLSSSVTTGGKGLFDRVKTEYRMIFKDKNKFFNRIRWLLEFADINKITIKEDCSIFANNVINYKNSFKCRRNLLFNKKMKSGSKVADLEAKFKILGNIY